MTHDVTVLLWISPRERGLGWQDRRHLHIQLGGNHEDTRRDRDRAACGRRQRSAADEGSRRRWLTCSCDDGHGHSIQQRRARAHFFGRPSVDHLHHQGNNPHRSTHVPGTVNATTTVTCTYTVEKISIGQALYRGGWIVRSSSATSTWRTNARSNAAVTCASGSYQNDSTAVVTFPLGYAPRILSGGDRSARLSIRCS